MRFPRHFQLPPGSVFHFMWRAINGEFFLSDDRIKRAFLDRLFKFFKVTNGAVAIYSFALLSNHFHQAGKLLEDSSPLSRWARSANSSFALWLNRKLNRRGPLAQDRPKTLVAQDQEALKRLMFYIDWNPVRAGLCRHPSQYKFSSYRFYAFGETNEWTRHLTPPDWYLELGDTAAQRQNKYRQQCDTYDTQGLLPADEAEEFARHGYALGDMSFVTRRNALLKAVGLLLRTGAVPRPEIHGYFTMALVSHDTPVPVPRSAGAS